MEARSEPFERVVQTRWIISAARPLFVSREISMILSRTSVPETGEAVVATRRMDCVRDMS